MAVLRPLLVIFCQLHKHLSQNWGSDGHFEVLYKSLNLIWFQSYDKNEEHAKTPKTLHRLIFFTKFQNKNRNSFILWQEQLGFRPQNDRLNLSFVKDIHIVGKKWPEVVLKRPFSIRKFWETPSVKNICTFIHSSWFLEKFWWLSETRKLFSYS